MSVVFEKPSDLDEYLFRIVDNGGATADRYTVVFTDGSFLTLSANPDHPQGVSMWGEGLDPESEALSVEREEAVDLAIGDLPVDLVNHILSRHNEAIADLLATVEANDANFVATARGLADVNENLRTDLGKGIYLTKAGYFVRLDAGPDADRGPYGTAREVVIATLPDRHSFAGPEFQSTLDVNRLTPDPAVAARVAELEARREAEYGASRRGV